MDVQALVSAVVGHALKQHEDSEWNTVVEGMTRPDIATVIVKSGVTRPRQAIRAMQAHLDDMRLLPATV